jgi:hypothetical protein
MNLHCPYTSKSLSGVTVPVRMMRCGAHWPIWYMDLEMLEVAALMMWLSSMTITCGSYLRIARSMRMVSVRSLQYDESAPALTERMVTRRPSSCLAVVPLWSWLIFMSGTRFQ